MSQQPQQPQNPGGTTHIGNYRLVRELGRGSMGTVYLAHQESLGRDLALKVLAPEFTRDPEFLERFQREGRAAARLRHPNIVQVFDAGSREGLYYIAMEYCGSKNLKDVIEEARGRLPLLRAVHITDQILMALEHAHDAGIIHRDVKPANVLIQGQDEVTLTDFSIAHVKTATRLTQTGTMIGTPEYMSPEQFDGRNIDHRADLYAAGVLLYEMLTGVQPFRGETTPQVMKAHVLMKPPNPCELAPNLPPALGVVLLKTLEKKPEFRFATAREMRLAIQEASGLNQAEVSLDQFLASVISGRISMDDAIRARERVKEAIDEGFRRVLTVMMVDLAGSSRIKVPSQTLHADRAFRDYRATINSILERQGCQAYDWSGDGAICLFEQAEPAVLAAIQIQQSLEDVALRHAHIPDRLLARIGINTGEVYWDTRRSLGEFASRTVDQAGHLEKDCPPGSIHVSASTAEITQHRAHFQEVGVNRDGLTVYRALGTVALQVATQCPKCGTATGHGGRFCPGCGADVSGGSLPQASAPRRVPTALLLPPPVAPPPHDSGAALRPVVPPPPASAVDAWPSPPPLQPEPWHPSGSSSRAPGESGTWQEAGTRLPPQHDSGSLDRRAHGVTISRTPGSGSRPAETVGFQPWWGWWMGVPAFVMVALGLTLFRSLDPLGTAMRGVGHAVLLNMTVLSPILGAFYRRRGRKSASRQAFAATAIFCLLFILSQAAR